MKESKFRSKVVEKLRPLLAFPVENYVSDGVPDICCTIGWIETKIAGPTRVNGDVPILIRPAQKIWLQSWRASGCSAWVLTHYDNDGVHDIWLLHEPTWACENYGHVDFEVLAKASLKWWVTTPSGTELIQALKESYRA